MTLQQEIIQAPGAKPQIDVAGEIRRSVDFLEVIPCRPHPFIKSLVLGISGGQDSTLTGKSMPDSRLTNCVPKPATVACSLSPSVYPMACRLMSGGLPVTPSHLSSLTGVLTVNISAVVLASETELGAKQASN
ncbi:hypothetical protein LNQ52_28220 [Klebsiella pneumoniae subsp. pneumoniae]|nr:hypothetical protein [Klebsiella pneumoniae subsp. pneumoniae]